MATIIGFVSQKGGVGKSTLARALAREAAASDLEVKVADLDIQQGTTINWQRRRLEARIEPTVSVESFRTASQALKLADQFDLLILDGPARTSKETFEIAQAADIVIQPTGASIDDLEPAILVFHELVKRKIPKSKLSFALTRVGTESEYLDAIGYIEEAGYSALDGCLFERPAYRQAQNEGHSITETRYKTLNQKADSLIQSLIDRIS